MPALSVLHITSPVDVARDQITKTLLHIHLQTIIIVLNDCLVNNSLKLILFV